MRARTDSTPPACGRPRPGTLADRLPSSCWRREANRLALLDADARRCSDDQRLTYCDPAPASLSVAVCRSATEMLLRLRIEGMGQRGAGPVGTERRRLGEAFDRHSPLAVITPCEVRLSTSVVSSM